MCCVWLAGNAGPKSRHLSMIAELCRAISSQLRHISTIGKKFVKQQCFPTCPCYGELRPTSGWDLLASLRHPCKFQRVLHLAALLHGTLVVGVSQTTLRRWTEGATISHWALAHISSCTLINSEKCHQSWAGIHSTSERPITVPFREFIEAKDQGPRRKRTTPVKIYSTSKQNDGGVVQG